jgi:large subunit ribosomal protein L21e
MFHDDETTGSRSHHDSRGTHVLYARPDNDAATMPNSNGPLQGTRNKLKNDPRDRGMSPPQRAVQQFEEGDSVHLAIDPSVNEGRFHPRFNGHTGTVVGQQGTAYQVSITDGDTEKTLVAKPAHLREQE